jgi:hypothetical protein
MKKFIKLHDAKNNSIFFVNTDDILFATVITKYNKKCTEMDVTYARVLCNESPEKIFNMLDSKSFIRFHKKMDNSIGFVSIPNILMIKTDDFKTYISLDNDIDIVINESAETIYNMIEKETYSEMDGLINELK